MTFDLITIGSISIDLYFKADSLTTKDERFFLALGGKYYPEDFYVKVGGGAANVAIGVKKSRLRSAACGVVGNNPFRKNILHQLKLKGISRKLILFRQKYDSVSVILLRQDGERTIIHYVTPHESLIGSNKRILDRLTKTRALYLGNLPDVSLTERAHILNYVKKRNVFVFANLGAKDCKRPKGQIGSLIKRVDVLIVNAHEFSLLAKTPYEKIDFKKSVLRFVPSLKNKILIVTDAENGSFGYEMDRFYYQKSIRPRRVVDSTGAGDAYTAGFIAEYLRSEDIQKAMRKGTSYATRILGKIGAN